MSHWNDLEWLRRELARAEAKSEGLSAIRAAMPPGSSRASVTTANSRWARDAEYRDSVRARIEELEAQPARFVPFVREAPAETWDEPFPWEKKP